MFHNTRDHDRGAARRLCSAEATKGPEESNAEDTGGGGGTVLWGGGKVTES